MSNEFLSPTMTLEEARSWFRARLSKGVACPCCSQRAQIYRFKFNAGMARLLIHMRRMETTRQGCWIHVKREFAQFGLNVDALNFYKIKYWGLVEPKEKDPAEDKNATGYWRLTDPGRMFVHNQCTIPTYVFFYNDKVLQMSESMISIGEALGTKFSYEELMRG